MFEKKFAEYVGTKYALSCFNGTVALHLALLVYDLKENDEVIVPIFTYIATANAVKYCNAKPVFVDIDEKTWNIDPKKIEEKITKKTKGIIVVHIYGYPANMKEIKKIAKRYNLFVIEDAAEAHGALIGNKRVGAIGDIGCFSFFGNKIITTGEGGMVVTNNDNFAKKIKLFKGQGMSLNRRYWFECVGYNYRMTNIQAAIGLGQLEKIDYYIKKRIEIANLYKKYLEPIKDKIIFPPDNNSSFKGVNWLFSIVLKDNSKISRDDLINKLLDYGIETRPFFYPLHLMPPYKSSEKFPVAEKIAARGLNLPTYSTLKDKEIKYISEVLKKIV